MLIWAVAQVPGAVRIAPLADLSFCNVHYFA